MIGLLSNETMIDWLSKIQQYIMNYSNVNKGKKREFI